MSPRELVPTLPSPRSQSAFSRFGDIGFRLACTASGWLVIVVVLALVALLTWQAWPVLSRAGEYQVFTSSNWDPTGKTTADGSPVFGAWVFIYGTVATSAIAMLIAVPLGVGTAAFLSEIAPDWLRRTGVFLSELLAAIPSVVFGFWGLFFVAPVVHRFFVWFAPKLQSLYDFLGIEWAVTVNTASGHGVFSAGLILAIMILPYITAISFDVCRAVPSAQRQGALALGATRWQMIRTVVLPYARPGILAACFLALGRALGETMAVTMLIGNVRYLDISLFGTGDSIASVIAGQLHEAYGTHRSALIALGLILFFITALTNVVGRGLIGAVGRPRGRGRILIKDQAPPPKPADEIEAFHRKAKRRNWLMTGVLGLCQVLTIVPLFLILGYIVYQGAPEVDRNLFLERPSPPGQPGGGLGHAMLGSLYMVLLATAFAVPVGIMAAIYLSEYRNQWPTKPIRFVTELLGGVPSIIIGIYAFSMGIFIPWADRQPGFSAWAGIFALAVMMLPVVIRATEEALKLVPGSLRQASAALGATQSQTVLRVIVPAAMPAILTGILLAMGRIAGETAPLLLTARGSAFWPGALTDRMASLPYYIYEFSTSSFDEQQDLAWGGAFVLLTFVIVLNVCVRLVAGKRVVSAARAE